MKNSTKSVKSKKYVSEEAEDLARQRAVATNLQAFLNACCANNLVENGWGVLLEYRSRCKKSEASLDIIDPKLYYTILSSFARKINMEKIKEVCAVIKEDNIAFMPPIYSYIFECLGREGQSQKNLEQIKLYKAEAESQVNCNAKKNIFDKKFKTETFFLQNISMDRIMNETLFVGDQRQIVLDAIRRVDNTYEPNYIAPSLLYNNNKLVEPLNKNILPIGESLNQSEVESELSIPETRPKL